MLLGVYPVDVDDGVRITEFVEVLLIDLFLRINGVLHRSFGQLFDEVDCHLFAFQKGEPFYVFNFVATGVKSGFDAFREERLESFSELGFDEDEHRVVSERHLRFFIVVLRVERVQRLFQNRKRESELFPFFATYLSFNLVFPVRTAPYEDRNLGVLTNVETFVYFQFHLADDSAFFEVPERLERSLNSGEGNDFRVNFLVVADDRRFHQSEQRSGTPFGKFIGVIVEHSIEVDFERFEPDVSIDVGNVVLKQERTSQNAVTRLAVHNGFVDTD